MTLLALGLPRDRFAVEVAVLTRSGPLEADLKAGGIPVYHFHKRHKFDPLALARLTRLLQRARYDIVQTWLFAANCYGRVAAHLAKTPVVIATEMAADHWKTPRELAIDRRLAAWTHAIVGNSQAVVDFYRDQGIDPSKLVRIDSGIGPLEPPPIDPAAIRASFGWEPSAFVAVFVGRLAPQKAVGDLVKAADLLQHGHPRLKTLIVGDGPDRDALLRQAAAFQLLGEPFNPDSNPQAPPPRPGVLRFTGHRDDAIALIAASDVLVLPSLYEGLPNVVLEAMALGKPVIVTRAPGNAELVEHLRTGLVVPPRDVTELARALRTLMADPDLAARLGRAGRDHVRRAYRLDAMLDQFAHLYLRLLNLI